tara:strand:+ start:19 stop:432 length:414 start_codon:yes stop_codon:yes gene_type:complete
MKFENKKLQIIRDLVQEGYEQKQTVFNEGPEPLTTEQKRMFVEACKTFSHMGESIYGSGKLKEIVERISSIVETASQLVTEEGEMVDSISATRQMKGTKEALKEFQKSANEVMIHERRMSAAFEDIAQGIQKYFDVG